MRPSLSPADEASPIAPIASPAQADAPPSPHTSLTEMTSGAAFVSNPSSAASSFTNPSSAASWRSAGQADGAEPDEELESHELESPRVGSVAEIAELDFPADLKVARDLIVLRTHNLLPNRPQVAGEPILLITYSYITLRWQGSPSYS